MLTTAGSRSNENDRDPRRSGRTSGLHGSICKKLSGLIFTLAYKILQNRLLVFLGIWAYDVICSPGIVREHKTALLKSSV